MVEIRGLYKAFGKVPVLTRLDLEVTRGSRVALLGRSGAGKTTLLRLIAGLDLPDRGEILLQGECASRPGWARPPHQRGLGFLFQASALWPHMTVAQNILFGLGGTGDVTEVLEQTRMTHLQDRYPHELSGGEERRAALARTLAPKPSLLLLDEPLTHADPETRQELLQVILGCPATLIYVCHDQEEAHSVAPRLLQLRDGLLS